jgi:hypothetical protein
MKTIFAILLILVVGCKHEGQPTPTPTPTATPGPSATPTPEPTPTPTATPSDEWHYVLGDFEPTKEFPVYKTFFNTPMGKDFREVRVSMEVVVGPIWPETGKTLNLFWLQRSKTVWRPNTYMYANLRTKDKFKMLSNTNGEDLVKTRGYPYKEGDRLFVEASYRPNGIASLQVNSQRVQYPVGPQEIERVQNGKFFIEIGFKEGEAGPERPTYGWQYKNIRVDFIE